MELEQMKIGQPIERKEETYAVKIRRYTMLTLIQKLSMRTKSSGQL